jgi:hypothetical protein
MFSDVLIILLICIIVPTADLSAPLDFPPGEIEVAEKKRVYETCKAKVQTIQQAYDTLVDAVEGYKALLTTLIEESNPQDEHDKHLLVVANLQRNTTNGLLGTLDTELHDDLTRLSDRVIRFKHLEDGTFV